MTTFNIKTTHKVILADIHTPVGVYLRLRDKFANSILLESSDYHSRENSYSYLCCCPISSIKAAGKELTKTFPNGEFEDIELTNMLDLPEHLKNYTQQFQQEAPLNLPFLDKAFFGFTAYDAVQYFEDLDFGDKPKHKINSPDLFYQFYKYVLVFDHYKNQLHLLEHDIEGATQFEDTTLESIQTIIENRNCATHHFSLNEEEESNISDNRFIEMVQEGKDHCRRGNVFQIVLSRRFQQKFKGDEFNVYRALRAINPSPYLFYFDFGSFKIMGSSPEAQLTIRDQVATINPIAGTYKRTGNAEEDKKLAEQLSKDPKENAEHMMLVDLARNDLSRHAENVTVKKLSEVQYFSHVIHLVSEVTGELKNNDQSIQLMADTFPAGTLSGAPKYRAMEIIDEIESSNRNFYGGAIGLLGLNGELNHAIIIRSLFSQDNTLTYQAGAGVVAHSNEESELQEVNNKISAVREAIKVAASI